jgi:hypothetical protein
MTDDDKALVERLRWGAWYFDNPHDGKAYASDDPLEAADRIEALEAQLKTVLDREAETHRRHDAKVEAQAAEIEQLRKVLKALYFDDYYGIWDNLSANGCCHGFKPAKRCPNEGCRHGELQTSIEAALGDA